MVSAVLERLSDISDARAELKKNGLSFIDPMWKRWLRRALRDRAGGIGDYLKSWDVNLVYKFISEKLDSDALILDIGCYKSEIIPILNAAGYSRLFGIDLNKETKFPINEGEFIFKTGNFYNMPLEDHSIDCISAISVIEHGYDGEKLFAEISRVLKPGGFFIASFDYWPKKIDVGAKTFFDLSWTIFDDIEVKEMSSIAKKFSMDSMISQDLKNIEDPVIKFDGFEYTFAMMIFQKL